LAKSCALQQLETDFKQFNVHIGVITETWFKPHHDDQYVSIPGYNVYRKDRAKRKGGELQFMSVAILSPLKFAHTLMDILKTLRLHGFIVSMGAQSTT